MNILAIDTATNACSAALLCEDVIHERFEVAPRAHTQLLLPMIEQVLTAGGIGRDKLDAIAFIAGPGSFTGIRIATSMAQGLSLGLNIPAIPVSALLALACGAKKETANLEIFPCIDARRGQVYWAHYSFAKNRIEPTPIVADCLSAADDMLAAHNPDAIIYGTGVPGAEESEARYPRASAVLELAAARFADGEFNPPGDAQAVYFRRGT